MNQQTILPYCIDLFDQKRLSTIEVNVGDVGIGGQNPIRLQSMTTTDTMNTQESVEQSIRMEKSGSELIRLTAPSKKEAENLLVIHQELREKGYKSPLVADIHFTPNAALIAAKYVEKVRVNPGNYADKKRFKEIEYTDETYQAELDRIELKFTPLVLLCKQEKRAIRIGTNHGSLSDRILSRYGDTPMGMVESALEFIRICEKNDFQDIVVSMKASNTLVMVQAYRLLCAKMIENKKCYPLHLGVTEAGDGEDGRIKSAVGIGALLADGLGDTIRVSLTEEPEYEIPVARKLAKKYFTEERSNKESGINIPYNPYEYQRRKTHSIHNIGGANAPVVFADLSQKSKITQANFFGFGYAYSRDLDKWNIGDMAADYVYTGKNSVDFEVPGTLGVICDYSLWKNKYDNKSGFYPLIKKEDLSKIDVSQKIFYLHDADDDLPNELSSFKNLTLVLYSAKYNKTQAFRKIFIDLLNANNEVPVILKVDEPNEDLEFFQLSASSDAGSVLIDGFGDGIWITSKQAVKEINSTSFGILQATRTRISKTEYISCPSCGRTLFDLQETTAKIRNKTNHLKGVKIGIMGCIVNGPGEMADADYGYVGTGPERINLYKEKTVVRKNVHESEAVNALIDLIKENGDWIDPTNT
ncbi:MAG: 4-hydroxy-3-methylbut-2-en-1-yl diphosphate synthase [Crocinitomicaceae bacterium]|nr:4-hydroxy-3-methylbut-2-en-1-yl diphosphate synthase [Crocinitomicaceae bacterium]